MIQNLKLKLYKKRVTKRSKLKDINECKIDSKIAQESIRKNILPYHLFAMNSSVIHGISVTLFLSESEVFTPFAGNSKPQKENSLSAYLNSLCIFNLAEREFSFWGLEFPANGVKTSLSDKNKVTEIPCITEEFIANRW